MLTFVLKAMTQIIEYYSPLRPGLLTRAVLLGRAIKYATGLLPVASTDRLLNRCGELLRNPADPALGVLNLYPAIAAAENTGHGSRL
ncbi:MAG: hypothetical protein Tsb002_19930 [Wenzhouxiangellaceae bacterium]